MHDPLSNSVLEFLELHIDTVSHLETLLLLWLSVPQQWSAAAVAARIYVSESQARGILDDLVRRSLVGRDADRDEYVFDVHARTAGLMPELAQSYRRELIAVSTFIHSKGSLSVREFARAFHIKGEPKK